ncbi:SNARE associated Golgi protein [uncultured archaeon]|nr:SNARE associated Golgi protein [uncultured archaeon]
MLDLVGNIEGLVLTFGYVAIFSFVFAESGLFFGFFLPGDSLLFTAGILAQRGILDLNILLVGAAVCAIAGDQVGYWMGTKYGRGFFAKPGDFFRDPKNISRAEEFYAKHGRKTIVLARFVPVVRTFAPIVAGIGSMDYKTFLGYNIMGGLLWTLAMVLGGYFLGGIPFIAKNLELIVLVIIFVSLLPVIYELAKGGLGKGGKEK